MADSLPMFAPDALEAHIVDPALVRAVEAALLRADAERWVERLHDRDASLWSADPEVQAKIANRLGWLDAPVDFGEQVPALEAFGESIRSAGFTATLVAGMGGSSLAPDVLADAFRDISDWLAVRVLDSTDPAAVEAAWDGLDPLATLVIVATKSGTTTESLAFQADAWARIHAALRAAGERRESPGDLMVAVTDPGRSLEAIPHHDDLREVFLNPEDVGGRYSALTYVGLVPASLLGLDLDAFLASAVGMLARTHGTPAATNPGAALGVALGVLGRAGRDKLTLVADPAVARFGAWLEQLIAESTGKHGVGIVPIAGEPLGEVAAYGPDRVFVRLLLDGAAPPAPTPGGTSADELLDALADAGHPVIRIRLSDPIDLAAEFVRWEVATALAGVLLEINPFDEPNVTESKENTKRVLAELERTGAFPTPAPIAQGDGLALMGDRTLGPGTGDRTPSDVLRRHLARARPDAYLALQAFVAPTATRAAALDRIRALLRDATRRATTSGFGPRFLHSTGQLHKGGAPIGWFLQLTADHPADVEIPGRPFSFGQLVDAQAVGDFEALESHSLPVVRVHLGTDVEQGLEALERALRDAVA
jgi:glucose-6-phosphate isomerase